MGRYVTMDYEDLIFVSQEFHAHTCPRTAATNNPPWESVVKLFSGVRSIRAFERALEKAEELLHYAHVPVKTRTSLPISGEVWRMDNGELELCARNGKRIYCI